MTKFFGGRFSLWLVTGVIYSLIAYALGPIVENGLSVRWRDWAPDPWLLGGLVFIGFFAATMRVLFVRPGEE